MPLALVFDSITRIVVDERGAVVSVVALDPMLRRASVLAGSRPQYLTPQRQRLSLRRGDRARVQDAPSKAGRFQLDRSASFRRHVRAGRDSVLTVTIVCSCGRRRERTLGEWVRRVNTDRGCNVCTIATGRGSGLRFGNG
jgi:hypothetical protein